MTHELIGNRFLGVSRDTQPYRNHPVQGCFVGDVKLALDIALVSFVCATSIIQPGWFSPSLAFVCLAKLGALDFEAVLAGDFVAEELKLPRAGDVECAPLL